MKKQTRTNLILWAVYVIYSFILTSTIIISGDDFFWFHMDSYKENFGETSHNGRYFTNIITYLMCNYGVIRFLVFFVTMIALFFLLHKLIRPRIEENNSIVTIFIIFGLVAIPSQIFTYTYAWVSGFTNYVLGTVMSFIFVGYCYPVLQGKELKNSPISALLLLIAGFLGAMCVENLTIFNISFCIFIIVLYAILFKKVIFGHITYLAGAITGTILMFNNVNYTNIFVHSEDPIAKRSVIFSLPDIFMKIYMEIIPCYAKLFVFIHLIIAVSVIYLYVKRYKMDSEAKPPKYAPFLFGVIISYALYSMFTFCLADFVPVTPTYVIRAIETAFVFVYIIALIYMAYIFFDKFALLRVIVFIAGTLVVTAPFLVVNPVTLRCFYSDYMLWLLVAGEFFVHFASELKPMGKVVLNYVMTSVATFFVVVISYFSICNKICDNIRWDYFSQQVDEQRNTIEAILLPFDVYNEDFITFFANIDEINDYDNPDRTSKYIIYMLEFYGIDPRDVDISRIYFSSLQDYFISQSE